jgi:fatty-acid desaturase
MVQYSAWHSSLYVKTLVSVFDSQLHVSVMADHYQVLHWIIIIVIIIITHIMNIMSLNVGFFKNKSWSYYSNKYIEFILH